MPDQMPVFRFAPSPNGHLHLGHAYSALFSWQMAKAMNGRFLLRIEDIDTGRSRSEYETAIYEDLAWLGIEWEKPVRRQSEHFAFYADYLDRLKGLDIIYPCFATIREIVEAAKARNTPPLRDPDGAFLYPGLHRDMPHDERQARIASGESYALRLDMRKAVALAGEMAGGPIRFRSFALEESGSVTSTEVVRLERWGDVVLARKEVPASYHLAVTVDDALQGVTHITRGADLLAATYIHRLLQILLNLPEPVYCHHPLVLDETGRKLSKSHGDKSLRSLRTEGRTREDIIRLAGLTRA
ncbi:MAG TPA: tRNA glutamyl-Q(34) synthetase GluQRS [Hyphomicrobiales bacterium]|nr:tRNA glutamyl-Q(34) synthetase GluQRS [Hyphomicrobiales bacterium]